MQFDHWQHEDKREGGGAANPSALVSPPQSQATADPSSLVAPGLFISPPPVVHVDPYSYSPVSGPAFASVASAHVVYDQYSKPWLMVGDTAFALITQLNTSSDWNYYFSTRSNQGYNCIYMNVLAGTYDSAGGYNGGGLSTWFTADGIAPFYQADGVTLGTGPADFDISQPNPTYFARLDAILTAARSYGLTIFLNPMDTGIAVSNNPSFLGGAGATVAKCTSYGSFIGGRYKGSSYSHVHYQHGNDYGGSGQNWTVDSYVGAIVNAVRAADPAALHAIELGYDYSTGYDNKNFRPGNAWASSTTYALNDVVSSGGLGYVSLQASNQGHSPASSPTWWQQNYPLDLDTCYCYSGIYANFAQGYNSQDLNSNTLGNVPTRPTYHVEGTYEDGSGAGWEPTNPHVMRMQAWYALTCGCFGFFYGNGYVFPFATTPATWQSALTHTGAVHMGYVAAPFRASNWQNLVPDLHVANLLTAQSVGVWDTSHNPLDSQSFATAAVTPAGDFGVVYSPVQQTLTVNMAQMRGSTVARWYDPTNGTYTTDAASPLANTGSHVFTVPSANSTGDHDFALVLTA